MSRRLWMAAVAVVVAGTVTRAAESLRIVPIVHDDQVIVTFELADAFTDQVREAISSGLKTTFSYDVELRMLVAAWMDRTIATVAVSVTDQYDNLTRRHTLTRIVDGREDDTLVTEDEAVVKEWLTTMKRLPLCRTSKLDPSRDYYVRIRARERPHGGSLLAWANGVTGQAKFTYIP